MTVSVVSHGHASAVQALLGQLCATAAAHVGHVILTHNLPSPAVAPPAGGWPFELTEVFNTAPLGFGANHNRAFANCRTPYFCVLNPDIELADPAVWSRLLEQASLPGVGCAYPALFNPDGSRQQNERDAVTPLALLRRHVLHRPERRVDWVSGAFWLVPSAVWRELGGFDERFFMYCEDTDFCLRLRLAGRRLARADARAVHGAGWASRQPGRPMAWHLRSLWRLWTQPPLWRYLAQARRARSTVENARQ